MMIRASLNSTAEIPVIFCELALPSPPPTCNRFLMLRSFEAKHLEDPLHFERLHPAQPLTAPHRQVPHLQAFVGRASHSRASRGRMKRSARVCTCGRPPLRRRETLRARRVAGGPPLRCRMSRRRSNDRRGLVMTVEVS